MRQLLAYIGAMVFGGWVVTHGQSTRDYAAEIDVLKREVHNLKIEVGPVGADIRELVEWLPNDPAAVTRMRMALGSNYFNHGGILRVRLENGDIKEVQDGGFVTFRRAAWTPVGVD